MITLPGFYLFCFAFGFFFSLVGIFSGHLHVHGHHGTHFHAGHTHSAGDLSPFNVSTLAAFLAWFGGAGYLATRYYKVWVFAGLTLSVTAGLIGASVIFWFLTRVLMREREDLNPADYDPVGVLARVTGTIREGGMGEILFSQAGIRRSALARGDDPATILSGTEVVVMRYENGVAYVRRWDQVV